MDTTAQIVECVRRRSTVSDPGSHLGHYRIVGKLGEGGMGVVYVATDERLGRQVAIKLLRERTDVVARRRFVREARALAHLSHPNVVQIHDIGEHDGQIFIVMEYIEGTDLGSWLQQNHRSSAEILEVFIAAGQGLMAAHERGIVHRDFKPANVMIGGDGRIRVVDFGVARGDLLDTIDDGAETPAPSMEIGDLTESGARVGTPAYMAPEQLRGDEAGIFTDQFSFCVALWEALYGIRPFHARTVDVALAKMDTGNFEGELDAVGVPSWLRAVVARGLAKEPDDRWPSLAALIHALGRPQPRTSAWGRKVGAVAMLVAGIVAGQYTSWLKYAQMEPQTQAVVLATDSRVHAGEQQARERDLELELEQGDASPLDVEPPIEVQSHESKPSELKPLEVPPPRRDARRRPLTNRNHSQVAGDVRKDQISIESQTMTLSRPRCASLLSCLRPGVEKPPT